MPTASTSQILNNNECIEPYTTNIYLRRTLAGEFVVVNNQLVRKLQELNIDFTLFEATDRVGGRVKTDIIDGFRLDHGFQVLLTAYPEAKHWLNYQKLDLRVFDPGAMLLYPDGSKDLLGDPLRQLSSLVPSVFSKAGNLARRLSGRAEKPCRDQREKGRVGDEVRHFRYLGSSRQTA